ncbi:hypothetical protein [Bradyrhizobium sp. LTSPM299]|uniref:hypothetical protein n=1 Tax=Bradyrhizobium sp. LTSPM299 TaxID=1619233 RepID=UPI0012E1F335|nr:hypothetical protein [Bradyrhizobium sp. LTSPM299]
MRGIEFIGQPALSESSGGGGYEAFMAAIYDNDAPLRRAVGRIDECLKNRKSSIRRFGRRRSTVSGMVSRSPLSPVACFAFS